jgi:endoglucanase
MRLRFSCLILVSALVFASAIHAQNREADVRTAFARAQHLKRGINTSHWFSQNASDYSAHHTDTETTPENITTISQLGFDNVRLSIDATPLEQGFHSGDFLARLDKAVDEILATGMAVQIDLHPEEPFKEQVRTSNNGVDRLVSLWRRLASHYATRDPERIFFEIMNEPEVSDPYRWAGIQARVAAAIREAAPANTIIATGPNYSDIVDLLTQHPLPDGNVIYNFHFYDPHEFTHQGANWGAPFWIYEHGIPYPPTQDSMTALVKQVPDLADRSKLEDYWLDHWDAHRIRLLIDEAQTWGKLNNVPLLCNEFGVYREKAEPASRLAWLRDVRSALEADGIGWAMWDYHEGFGVAVRDKDGKSVVDPATVEALGLQAK